MIPIKLELEAFGPFLEKQVIDFTEFDNDKIFLISGKTGSGKTSIFDAISFSLYGVASGDIREPDSFKSDFASDSTICYTELTFIIHGKQYTVRREPIQYKLKKNGNLVKESSTALLTDENNMTISGTNEVNAKISDLLGLNSDQFKKIVMLPQGEFRKFLSDDSNEKQKTLRKIFSTQLLDNFTAQLRINANTLQLELNEYDTLIKAYVNNIKESDNQEIIIAKENETPDIKHILKLLKESNKAYQVKENEYKQLLSELNKAKDSINIPYAKEINTKFSLLSESENTLKSLLTQKNDFDLLLKQITILKSINDISLLENSIIEHALTLKEVKCKIEKYKLESDENSILLLKATNDYNAAKQKQEKLPSLAILIEEKKQQLVIIEKHNKLRMEFIKQKNLTEKHTQDLDTYNLAYKFSLLRTEKDILAKKLSDLNNIHNEIMTCKATTDKFKTSSDIYKAAMNSFIEGQAFFLAGSLKSDTPCPVCGSLSHPSPAKETTSFISKDQLDQQEQHYNEASRRLREQQTICKQLLINAGFEISSHSKLSEFLPELELQCTQFQSQINEYNENLNIIKPSISQSMLEYDGQLLNDKINITKTDIALLDQNCFLIEKNISELNVTVNADKDKTENEIRDLTQRINEINGEFNTSSILKEKLKIESEHYKEAIYQQNCVLEQTEKSKLAKQNEFEQKLKNANIDLELYDSQKGLLPSLDKFEKELFEYNDALSQNKAVIRSLTAQLKDLSPVNLSDLQQEHNKLTQQIDVISTKLSDTLMLLNNNTEVYKNLYSVYNSWQKSSKKHTEYQRFYDIASGKFSDKINFERYALASYFIDVIKNANIRLEQMTNSRYTLNRRLDREKGNKASGLSLEVFDAYTGKTRHVNTLSGGESFKISLCLALGLADITSQNSGGIELNTMFIDEGFGSLDSASLDSAVECLMDLRESGRYIGIISHVSELKDKIPSKLFVVQEPQGSYIKTQK